MCICGLGLDIVEVEQITMAMARDVEYAEAWFTAREQLALGGRLLIAQVVAGRIAAKEAVVKALGTGFAGDIAWQDVEVLTAESGAPRVFLSGGAARVAQSFGKVSLHLTISHTERVAAACVVATT